MRCLLIFIITVIATSSGISNENPKEFARSFYRAQRSWKIRGEPTSRQIRLVSPYLGIEMLQAYRQVNKQREEWAKKYPTDQLKPPWCQEGDTFSTNYEGVSHYSIGRVRRVVGRTVVDIHLEYCEGSHSHSWTDRVILDRSGDDWVIADIEYESGGSLLENLLEGIKTVEAELKK